MFCVVAFSGGAFSFAVFGIHGKDTSVYLRFEHGGVVFLRLHGVAGTFSRRARVLNVVVLSPCASNPTVLRPLGGVIGLPQEGPH